MGFFSNVASRIREYWRTDKEQAMIQIAKGTMSPGRPETGYDILQAYGYDVLSDYLRLEHDLLARYVDYEEMDDYPEISAAIDIYSDDASQPDTMQRRSVWLTSPDATIEQIGDDLFHRTLRIDEEIWEIARTVTKYGNDFEEILVSPDGVIGLNFLPPPTVRRIEGPRGELFGFVQDFKGRFGYCLAAGSRVWTDRGLIEIQNFERGSVLGYVNGSAQLLPVKQKHVSGTKRVFRVKTQHREVFVTEDHPMLAQVGNGPVDWTKVKDLKIVRYNGKKRNIDYSRSSKLVISTRMPRGEVPTWESIWTENPFDVAWGNKGSPVQLLLPDRPTEDFCQLFGFLLGDGWFGAAETDTRVYFARGVYPELNDKYDGLLRQLGLNVEVKPVVSDGEVTGEMSVASSVQFKRLMHALGWIPGFDHKRVPSWMYALPEEHREAFLRGFLDADGWMNSQPGRRPRYFFEVANYDLARDFKNLIDGLGYVCGNLYKRTRKPGTVVKGKAIRTQQTCYGLSFTDEKFEKPFVTENVLKISYYEDAEVFDLEVDDPAHNFIADGLVVHNSPEEFKQVLATRTAMLQGGAFDAAQAGYGGFDKVAALEDWEVVHFRLRGKHRRSIYGYSVLEPARWIWKRLMLLEDAALVFRIQRAPERYAYYVDVGDLPPAEAFAYVNRIRQQNRKKKFVNPTTGKLDLKFDPMSYDEDFYIPVRKDSNGNRIEVLAAPNWQHMDDIEYFRDKLFASIKIPKAYLGQEEGVARAVLSSEDVRFARTVLRIQRELRNGLSKVFRVHLAALNIDPSNATWDVHMTTPSAIFELAQLEVRNARADFAGRMKEFVSLHWILSHVFGMNDDEIAIIIKQRKDEMEADAASQAVSQAKAQKAAAMYIPNSPEVQAAMRLDPAAESRARSYFRTLPPWKTGGISERDLFEGSREGEKRAADKLDKLLKSDLHMQHRLKELQGLLYDLRDSVRSIRG